MKKPRAESMFGCREK